MKSLLLGNTDLSEIQVVYMQWLENLSLRNTNIKALDISNLSELHNVDVSGTLIEELYMYNVSSVDVSRTPIHTMTHVYSEVMQLLTMKNCPNLQDFDTRYFKNLRSLSK